MAAKKALTLILSLSQVCQEISVKKEGNVMPKQETKGGNGKAPQQLADAGAEVSRWFVGKSLLNGGNKLKPELQALLDQLTIKVTQVVTNHGPEPLICLKGPKNSLDGLAAIAKGKVA